MAGRWVSRSTGLVMLILFFAVVSAGGAEERYTVQSGDSLYKIAKIYGISIDAIKTANHLEREKLSLNQVLLIPVSKRSGPEGVKKDSVKPASYVVKKGDSLSAVSMRVGLSVDEIKRLNGLRTNQLKPGQTLVLATPQRVTVDSDEELGDDEGEEASGAVSEEEKREESEAFEEAAKWKNENERNLFVRLVKTFLGVPYRLGGSTLKGIDCSAFVKRIYEVFNVQLPRTTWEQIRFGKRVKKEELAEGDLVFFRIPTRRASNRHVGIYIGNNEFVHASSRNKEVRVDNLETPYFSKRFLNGVRVKEFEEEL